MEGTTTKKPPEVAIFWDYENVHIPSRCSSPLKACAAIVRAVSQYGRIQQRRVYADYSRGENDGWSCDISESGFDLVSTPRRGAGKSKETLDRKMINDIIFFAWDVLFRGGNPCVVLITSDGDFAYTINKLRDRGASNVVIHGSSVAHILTSSADVAMHMERDVLADVLQPPQVASILPQGFQSPQDATCPLHAPTNKSMGAKNSENETPRSRTVTGRELVKQAALLSPSSSDISDGNPTNSDDDDEQLFQDMLTLCKILVANDTGWELGSQLGAEFRLTAIGTDSTTAKELKNRFRLASSRAMAEGLVLQGRRRLLQDGTKGEIVHATVSLLDSGSLSTHQYLKLTQAGLGMLASDLKSRLTANSDSFNDESNEIPTCVHAGEKVVDPTLTTTSSSDSSLSEGGSWRAVPVKDPKEKRHSIKTGNDVSACLFIKNVPTAVSLRGLVRCLKDDYGLTVLQGAVKDPPFPSYSFYFVRVVMESAQEATTLLRIANEKQLRLAGRIMTAAYDRWPRTKSTSDPALYYRKGETTEMTNAGTPPNKQTFVYIENIPNGTDIGLFVKEMATKYSVHIQQAVIAQNAQPHHVFWNAHATISTSLEALKLLQLGKKRNDKTSGVVFGGRYIWVKRDTDVPIWSMAKGVNSSRMFCATKTWAQAATSV